MNRRSFRVNRQNRFGMFLVTVVVLMLLLVVSVNCIQLRQKKAEYQTRIETLQEEIASEEERQEELEELKKYVQTNAYIESVAKDKLGLVHKGEIVFRIKR